MLHVAARAWAPCAVLRAAGAAPAVRKVRRMREMQMQARHGHNGDGTPEVAHDRGGGGDDCGACTKESSMRGEASERDEQSGVHVHGLVSRSSPTPVCLWRNSVP